MNFKTETQFKTELANARALADQYKSSCERIDGLKKGGSA